MRRQKNHSTKIHSMKIHSTKINSTISFDKYTFDPIIPAPDNSQLPNYEPSIVLGRPTCTLVFVPAERSS